VTRLSGCPVRPGMTKVCGGGKGFNIREFKVLRGAGDRLGRNAGRETDEGRKAWVFSTAPLSLFSPLSLQTLRVI